MPIQYPWSKEIIRYLDFLNNRFLISFINGIISYNELKICDHNTIVYVKKQKKKKKTLCKNSFKSQLTQVSYNGMEDLAIA